MRLITNRENMKLSNAADKNNKYVKRVGKVKGPVGPVLFVFQNFIFWSSLTVKSGLTDVKYSI